MNLMNKRTEYGDLQVVDESRRSFEIASLVVTRSTDISEEVRAEISRRLIAEHIPQPIRELLHKRIENEQKQEEIIAALEASRAGFIVCDTLSGTVDTRRKKEDNGQIYSAADTLSSQVISAVLAEKFPSYGRLDEEMGGINLEAENCWIIDPLDGSAPFVRDIDGWAVGIALHQKHDVKNGGTGITFGVVSSPQRKGNEVVFGGKGLGCWNWNGQNKQVSKFTKPKDLSFSAGSRDIREHDWSSALQFMAQRVSRVVSGFDTQFSGALLANGSIDFLVRIQQPSYDIASVIGIVEGAGGKVKEIGSMPLVIHRDTVRRHNIFAWNGQQGVVDFFAQHALLGSTSGDWIANTLLRVPKRTYQL